LVEEEIDPCRVRVEPQSAEGEHFLEETRGGSGIDRVSDRSGCSGKLRKPRVSL
jgi:hypothetical protein